MQQYLLSFLVLNLLSLRYSVVRLIVKGRLLVFGLVTSLLCFSVSAKGLTIDGIVHPESAFTTRDGRIFISEIGGVGKKGDGRILEIFTNGQKKVIASGHARRKYARRPICFVDTSGAMTATASNNLYESKLG